MATKHDLILEHIENLPVGERISVRSIAKICVSVKGLPTVRLRMQKILV